MIQVAGVGEIDFRPAGESARKSARNFDRSFFARFRVFSRAELLRNRSPATSKIFQRPKIPGLYFAALRLCGKQILFPPRRKGAKEGGKARRRETLRGPRSSPRNSKSRQKARRVQLASPFRLQ
jgi:hypothetical protein